MRQHCCNPIYTVGSHFRSLGEEVGQVEIGIQIVCNCSLDDAERDRTRCGTLRRVGKQKVLPVNYKGLNTAFRNVVADLQTAVVQIFRQFLSVIVQIGQRFSKLGFGAGGSGRRPCQKLVKNRLGQFLPLLLAFFIG